jgi:hypothetical protein
MSENDPPHGVTLVAHAEIAALIAEGQQPQREVLAAAGLTEPQWNDATMYWMPKLASDAAEKGAEATLAIEYSDAFAAAQERLAATVAMTPEEWATLTVEIQSEGGTGEPLARRRLSLPDYLRVARQMAKRLSTDASEQKRFMSTYLALQPNPRA